MLEPRFKIGDVVQLNSGGPNMTVVTAHPGMQLYCSWFSAEKLMHGSFEVNTVTLVTVPDKTGYMGERHGLLNDT